MKAEYHIIHAPGTEIQVKQYADIHCPREEAYVVAANPNPLIHMKTLSSTIKERDKWVAKYNNVLKGLKYWKGKANEI